ncbi:MAG: hypothetical protein KGL39_31415 [Patescibacteria group bacterium]|nr:hypothetical protein [Patescibacteria group bacterium]
MKYLPAAIAQSDIQAAVNPYLGGEFQVFLSDTPAIELAQIAMTSSGNGSAASTYCSYTAKAGVSIVGVGGTGADLQMVAEERLTSAVNCVVTLNVTDDLGATTTATATFAPPSRASNQGSNFGKGYAVDLQVQTGATRKIASITGVASIVGGSRGAKFSIYQLPELASYILVGATTEKKFNTKSRGAVGIDIGMLADAAIKLGKTKKGELTIDSKFGSMSDGLNRFDGARCTALLVGLKDEVLTEQNLVFTSYIPSVEVTAPEGDGESMANAATGKFADHLFFVAP